MTHARHAMLVALLISAATALASPTALARTVRPRAASAYAVDPFRNSAPRGPRVRVRIGTVRSAGGVSPEQLRRVLRQHFVQIERCFGALPITAFRQPRDVLVRLVADARGVVSMTRAEYAEGSPASGRDRAVLDCIGDEVRRFALQPAEAMPTTAMLRLRVDHVTR